MSHTHTHTHTRSVETCKTNQKPSIHEPKNQKPSNQNKFVSACCPSLRVPFLTLLLLQLLVAGRVSLQAGGSGAASTLPAAAGLELDLHHARPGLGARSQGAKPSTCWGGRASESESPRGSSRMLGGGELPARG